MAASAVSAQTHHDTLRGIVTSDSGRALRGAEIIITMAPLRDSRMTKADASGHYSILFADGTGDYLVHISAIGYETFRKRVTRVGTDSVFTVDAKLANAGAQKLAAVSVSAQKPTPPGRDENFRKPGVGSAEQIAGGVSGAVSPDHAGNLVAIASTIPGIATTPGGLSVAGLSAGQNSTTLNGMAFGGADIPRDAATQVRVSRSSYDPARGWFGGMNENVELTRGQIFSSRRTHLTVDAPLAQYTDPISSAMGQRFSNIVASFGGDGAMDDDKYAYNFGVQASRRSSDAVTLTDAGSAVLQGAGVSTDSANRLFDILSAAGVPLRARTVPSSHVTQNASFIARFDRAPYNWTTFRPARTTWGLLTYAKLASDNAVTTSPTATAAQGGSSSQAIGMIQALYSTYFHADYLNEEKSAFTYSRNRSEPYLTLPSGSVLVASSFPDATGGLTALAFGGNGALLTDTRRWTWETTSQTEFYAQGREAHRVKLNFDSRFDAESQQRSSNSLGSYSYNSLADLAANQPAIFTRTLSTPTAHGSVWNGFLAVGDLWRVSPDLQLMYGARLEANRFTSAPASNPAVQSAFGLRTDAVPNTVHLSPRIGFTWVRRAGGNDFMASRVGEFRFGPPSYVRGGIGEFRNFLGADLLTNASIATGLPGAVHSVTCVGPAIPVPDWGDYISDQSAIPSECVAGATPAFTDAAPSVQLFDPSYTAPRSWRANLAYSSTFRNTLLYSIEGLYSLNVNQPGRTDVNFANVPRFTLSGEGRPVFVRPTSIVATSGTISPVDARVAPAFGHVINNVSSLTSRSSQITIRASPSLAGSENWWLSTDYTLSNTHALQSGFDGSTFGSPAARSWSRGNLDVRHQFLVQGGYAFGSLSLTLFGNLQSGLPFTPMVGGDVNGDGIANDRAFIFNPATVADQALAASTRTLLASSSSRIRSCLTRQIGSAAKRNSCEGPWTTALNAQLSYSSVMPITHRYGTISLAFSNPLGGLDQLLHGATHLHGWGTAAYPDPVLYTPQGFNSGTDQFKYVVNPRFGNTSPTNTLLRAPFRVTLDISLLVGRPIEQQQLNRWIAPGRTRSGPKLSAAELKRRYSRSVPNPYEQIISESDSLLLTREQSEALQQADSAYLRSIDSVWTSLAEDLAGLPNDFNSAEALRRQEAGVDAGWEIARVDVQRNLPRILNPIQLKMVPGIAALLMKTTEKVQNRLYMP
jgi:hypothetical protein